MKPITLSVDPIQRVKELDTLHNTLDDLVTDKPWNVFIEPVDESRRTIQNELLWCWHKEWAFHNGESVSWAHASTKLELLLPLKLASESKKHSKRGRFEQFILSHVPNYEYRIGAAYDQIRSKDIPLKMFAEWLSIYQRVASQNGLILTSIREDLQNKALMREADERAERAA